jgi:hypothetical protein
MSLLNLIPSSLRIYELIHFPSSSLFRWVLPRDFTPSRKILLNLCVLISLHEVLSVSLVVLGLWVTQEWRPFLLLSNPEVTNWRSFERKEFCPSIHSREKRIWRLVQSFPAFFPVCFLLRSLFEVNFKRFKDWLKGLTLMWCWNHSTFERKSEVLDSHSFFELESLSVSLSLSQQNRKCWCKSVIDNGSKEIPRSVKGRDVTMQRKSSKRRDKKKKQETRSIEGNNSCCWRQKDPLYCCWLLPLNHVLWYQKKSLRLLHSSDDETAVSSHILSICSQCDLSVEIERWEMSFAEKGIPAVIQTKKKKTITNKNEDIVCILVLWERETFPYENLHLIRLTVFSKWL